MARAKGKKIWHVFVNSTNGDVYPLALGPVQKGEDVWFHPLETEFQVEVSFPLGTPFKVSRDKASKKQSVKQTVVVDVDPGNQISFPYGTPNVMRLTRSGPEIIVDGGRRRSGGKKKAGGAGKAGRAGRAGKKKAAKKR